MSASFYAEMIDGSGFVSILNFDSELVATVEMPFGFDLDDESGDSIDMAADSLAAAGWKIDDRDRGAAYTDTYQIGVERVTA